MGKKEDYLDHQLKIMQAEVLISETSFESAGKATDTNRQRKTQLQPAAMPEL